MTVKWYEWHQDIQALYEYPMGDAWKSVKKISTTKLGATVKTASGFDHLVYKDGHWVKS